MNKEEKLIEAADLLASTYPLEYQSPVYSAFIAGATHEETERYYRDRFEEELNNFCLWLDDCDGAYPFSSFSEGLQLYRESVNTTKPSNNP